MTLLLDEVDACVEQIIARVGNDVRIGLPLGLGKPVELVNALYARAQKDAQFRLTVLTALSLEKPAGGSRIEKAFLAPFVARVYGGCPDLHYVRDQRLGKLPPNVRVREFFFKPGSMLGSPQAQRDYISTNYTFAARDVFAQGCNVTAQIVAKRETPAGARYSLSCNPDTSPELIRLMRAAGKPCAVVALVNQNLPYMARDAEFGPEEFDFIIEHPRYTTTLFSTPKLAVGTADYAVGLNASALIADGGTLQVGIGALGDAVVHALRLRQQDNAGYQRLLGALGTLEHAAPVIESHGGAAPFARGLYGATEMFVDGLLPLMDAGVLKREVYDFWALQQLVNEQACDPARLDASVLDALEALGVRALRTQDFERLQHHGFFSDATRYERGHIVAPDGARVVANLADPEARRAIADKCLGAKLRHGVVLHGGFFLGPQSFYDGLRAMTQEQRDRICMTGVDKVNQLDGNPRLYRAQRVHARFVNTAMMVTLNGAAVSDGLADGRVVSGVGGQYNFVAMAHQLPTGRSIILVRAAREDGGAAQSNLVWNYAHCTIPRHLRDIVVTEYGIADLRGKTDEQVIMALLDIADARFQPALLAQAVKANTLDAGYRIPEGRRHNTRERLQAALADARGNGALPDYPLGSDFTAQEQRLAAALAAIKQRAAQLPKWRLALKAVFPAPAGDAQADLERLQLTGRLPFAERTARALLLEELHKARPAGL